MRRISVDGEFIASTPADNVLFRAPADGKGREMVMSAEEAIRAIMSGEKVVFVPLAAEREVIIFLGAERRYKEGE